MENEKERVLAFKLAKAINIEDLKKVSGGRKAELTGRTSAQASASNPSNADTTLDGSIDW